MAQFNQNISEQFKAETLSVGWPWRLFIFSIAACLVVVAGYAGLRFGYQEILKSSISNTDKQLTKLSESVTQKDEEGLIISYSQLINLKKVLDNHVFSSKIFPLLERDTHARVYYNDFNLKATEEKLILSGVANSFKTLSEQLAAFDNDPLITSYMLEESSVNEGSVNFRVSLILADNLFK
ncbi:MAG: hypothetical protein PHN74_01430 [Candidatus Pacebacteria bacterium]|nr:hypothetical protein [Candidatus Paceibacterota bacterium]